MYLRFCLALLIVPLLALWLWYRKHAAERLRPAHAQVVALLTLLWGVECG